MSFVKAQFDRLLALLLVSTLAACGPGEQQAQQAPAVEEATEQAAEQVADAAEEMPAEQAADAAEEPPAEPDRFANMFVSEVTHDFNPGLPIGAQFPEIRALFEGEEIMTIDRFIRDRGAIFIAARSTDW